MINIMEAPDMKNYEKVLKEKSYYERKTWNLKSLVELSLIINTDLHIDHILDVVVLTCMGELMTESVGIFLPDKFGEYDFKLSKYKGEHTDINLNDFEINSSSKIIDFLNARPLPARIDNIKDNKELLSDVQKIKIFDTKVIAPLVIKTELNGILVLGKKLDGNNYSADDLHFIEILSHIVGIALENARLYEEATFDFKTGLYLYKNFKIRAHKEFARCKRFNEVFSLIMIDLDYFKKLNDTYGHNQGDMILKHLGKIISDSIREIDIPARFGGEEFIILCTETNKEQATILAERLQQKIRGYDFPGQNMPLKVTASFGIVEIDLENDKKLDDVMERVDVALYKSKQNGRDMITVE